VLLGFYSDLSKKQPPGPAVKSGEQPVVLTGRKNNLGRRLKEKFIPKPGECNLQLAESEESRIPFVRPPAFSVWETRRSRRKAGNCIS